jgi:hypothetical protein
LHGGTEEYQERPDFHHKRSNECHDRISDRSVFLLQRGIQRHDIPEDGDSVFRQNGDNHLQVYTVSQLRRPQH